MLFQILPSEVFNSYFVVKFIRLIFYSRINLILFTYRSVEIANLLPGLIGIAALLCQNTAVNLFLKCSRDAII